MVSETVSGDGIRMGGGVRGIGIRRGGVGLGVACRASRGPTGLREMILLPPTDRSFLGTGGGTSGAREATGYGTSRMISRTVTTEGLCGGGNGC